MKKQEKKYADASMKLAVSIATLNNNNKKSYKSLTKGEKGKKAERARLK